MTDNASRRVRRCLSSLLAVQPFFGHLALRMPIQADKSRQTLAADGERIFFNPTWVQDTPADDIKAAISRCVLACSLHHHTRRGERTYDRWQEASRLATLPLLRDAGLTTEDGGEDDAVERIYARLPEGQDGKGQPPPGESGQPQDGNGEGDDQGDGQDGPGDAESDGQDGGKGDGQDGDCKPSHDPHGAGEIMDAPQHEGESAGDMEERLKEQEQEWDEARQQALQAGTAQGKRPGKVGELLASAHSYQMDWRALLERFMRSAAERDYSWSRPNRRFIASGLYLPSLCGIGMGPITLAIDTSASMDSEALQNVWGEIRSLAAEIEPDEIRVIHCDAVVQAVERFTDVHDLPDRLQAKGRGGTMYSPAMQAINDLPDSAVVVYFTDLYCNDFDVRPQAPLIWCVQPHGCDNNHPPFGEVVHMTAQGDA